MSSYRWARGTWWNPVSIDRQTDRHTHLHICTCTYKCTHTYTYAEWCKDTTSEKEHILWSMAQLRSTLINSTIVYKSNKCARLDAAGLWSQPLLRLKQEDHKLKPPGAPRDVMASLGNLLSRCFEIQTKKESWIRSSVEESTCVEPHM